MIEMRNAKTQVVINEQHRLVKNQEELLREKFGDDWEIFPVPMSGWDFDQLQGILKMLKGDPVVFASPVPYLLKELASYQPDDTYIFYNDTRNQKNVVPSKSSDSERRTVYSVAKTGWRIV